MEKIGAGGMGQVFKARHRRMDRLVAVKLLPTAMTKDKAAIARFEREVKAAAKLRHPNIVAADDADEANGVHFLVMELVDGNDLSALVKQNGPFSVEHSVSTTFCSRPEGWNSPTQKESSIVTSSRQICCSTRKGRSRFWIWDWHESRGTRRVKRN